MTTHWTPEQESAYSPPVSRAATEREQMVEAFRSMASEIAEMDFSHVEEDDVIADLGMDSLSMLELVGTMEREYEVRIPEEQLVSVETVRQLLDVVQQARGADA
jgi:acyl carrier protein